MKLLAYLPKMLLIVFVCLLLASPAYAQEATAEAPAVAQAEAAPTGVSTLILLIGLGAVLLVGAVAIGRERSQGGSLSE